LVQCNNVITIDNMSFIKRKKKLSNLYKKFKIRLNVCINFWINYLFMCYKFELLRSCNWGNYRRYISAALINNSV